MAVGKLKIGKLNISFVFRHRFEKPDDIFENFRHNTEFREWELGFWFRKRKMLGVKGFTKPNHHLVNSYIVGINLLICKAWVEWNINGLEIDEK